MERGRDGLLLMMRRRRRAIAARYGIIDNRLGSAYNPRAVKMQC